MGEFLGHGDDLKGEDLMEGGLLHDGSENDGYEGLGQVPLCTLPPFGSSRQSLGRSWWQLMKRQRCSMRMGKGRRIGGGSECVMGGKLFDRFSNFLGFPTMGYEEYILDLMKQINDDRLKGKGKGGVRPTK